MPSPLHPAIRILVDEVRGRLRAPELPDSAVRGALHEALAQSEPPSERLTTWIESLLQRSVAVLCRRLGLTPPAAPSLQGIISEEEPRDLASEIVSALLEELDADLVTVLKQLEVRDVRSAQVAVRLGLPPKRVGVMARQARDQVRCALVRYSAKVPSPR
ncbi:MAG: hypothetical protein EA397_09485 [Deltaproteobacteria bacterium]|nr:MAG: hypothetical protein EA397_09485 [Deltaproteobacteria bacterium]